MIAQVFILINTETEAEDEILEAVSKILEV